MKYGAMLILLGLAQLALAYPLRPVSWLIGWSGLSWVVAGCGYAFLGARVFGKQKDGRLPLGNVVLLLPFLLVTWLLWHLQIALSKEPHHVEVAPGLWLGRRCYARELPPDIQTLVDLTAEFAEPSTAREGRVYLCLPTLDASIPTVSAFNDLVESIARSEAPVYLHCALGHGRSATVIVAVLVAKGIDTSLASAEQRVKAARPGIEINAAQQALLQQWWSARSVPGAAPSNR